MCSGQGMAIEGMGANSRSNGKFRAFVSHRFTIFGCWIINGLLSFPELHFCNSHQVIKMEVHKLEEEGAFA
jgi:hypothetical protein